MLPVLRQMREAVSVPIAAQPAAFHTTDETPCFTRLPAFPDALETIQIERAAFRDFARVAKAEGFGFIGGCCRADVRSERRHVISALIGNRSGTTVRR